MYHTGVLDEVGSQIKSHGSAVARGK